MQSKKSSSKVYLHTAVIKNVCCKFCHNYAYKFHIIVIGNSDIKLAGDGRFDSPGHCARYCTYTFIDVERSHMLQDCTCT